MIKHELTYNRKVGAIKVTLYFLFTHINNEIDLLEAKITVSDRIGYEQTDDINADDYPMYIDSFRNWMDEIASIDLNNLKSIETQIQNDNARYLDIQHQARMDIRAQNAGV